MNRRSIFLVCAILLTYSINLFAQNVSETNLVVNARESKGEEAKKVDEFGRVGDCDMSGRLDNFLVTLQNNSTLKGVIITYHGTDALPANYGFPIDQMYRNYIRFRNFDASRIEFIEGGFRTLQTTELWVVPASAEMPKPSETVPKPTLPSDQTFLYDRNTIESNFFEELYFYADYLYEYLLPSVKAEREAENLAREEEWKSDSLDESQTIDEEIEIEQPKTPEEIEAEKFSWLSEKFGEVIKNQKNSSGVIIFYADDQLYDIARLQTFIDEGRDRIGKFWIMSKNGAFPTPTPEERPIEEDEDTKIN
jgi:hypothetical protein